VQKYHYQIIINMNLIILSTLILNLIGAPLDGDAGASIGSPGVLSGNNIQVPVHVPVNVCGNTVNVVALLNPAFGNTCVNS
jgi:hypothetical protein